MTVTSTLRKNTKKLTLNNGQKIPVVGFGTWKATGEGEAYKAVKTALQNGYRHIDTAEHYHNEEEVGKGIKDSGVNREEIFVTTKLWNVDHKKVREALELSLKRLGLDYIDLYLIHWPLSIDPVTNEPYKDWDYVDTYKELQKVMKTTGQIKSIGVSNLSINQLERLLNDEEVTVKPVVNQIEAHPLLTQPDLYDYMASKDIKIEAYSPLGSVNSPLFKNETIVHIAHKYGVEPANVLISWAVQRGTIVLPKSTTEHRIISNLNTFRLHRDDFETLNNLSLKYGIKRTNDPAWYNFE